MPGNKKLQEESRRWIEAGKTLGRDAGAMIRCPSCEIGFLRVSDAELDDGHYERWMRCNRCGKANTLLMTKDQIDGKFTIPSEYRLNDHSSTAADEPSARNFDWLRRLFDRIRKSSQQ